MSRATGMLAKTRHYVSENTLRSIYFGIFSSLLTYGAQIWGQFTNKHVCRLQKLQNKAIRIINFVDFREAVDPLYYKSKILKLTDHVKLQNFLFVHNSLNNNLPLPLQNTFKVAADNYVYNTRASEQHKIVLPKIRTSYYGLFCIKYRSGAHWNLLVNDFPKEKFHTLSKSVCQKKITKHLIECYNT